MVCVTIGMNDRAEINGWYFNGQFMDWSVNDHGAVLIGYDESIVTIADPLAGVTKYDRAQFEKVFESRRKKCIIVKH